MRVDQTSYCIQVRRLRVLDPSMGTRMLKLEGKGQKSLAPSRGELGRMKREPCRRYNLRNYRALIEKEIEGYLRFLTHA